MQLAALVDTSIQMAATRSRRAKVALLRTLLQGVPTPQVALAVSYLVGSLPQGKVGVGYSTLRALHVPAAVAPSLPLLEVDGTFAAIKLVEGSGANARRTQLLGGLLAKATQAERKASIWTVGLFVLSRVKP